MTWLIGLDEAGYGPNLGPFVMSCVAVHLEEESPSLNLWERLKNVVRRVKEKDENRIPVADSKELYTPARGLSQLETAVLATLPPEGGVGNMQGLLARADHRLSQEYWFTGQTAVPVVGRATPQNLANRFAEECRAQSIGPLVARSVIVCAPEFNELAEGADSKAAVVVNAFSRLTRSCLKLEGTDRLLFFVDKLGGRNNYAGLLQDTVPSGMVFAREEGPERSVYSLHGGERKILWTFQPRADAEHFPVALASMLSKYLREILMGEFNAYWLRQRPGLKPTAGYPMDAKRFFEAIRDLLPNLGLTVDQVWRHR